MTATGNVVPLHQPRPARKPAVDGLPPDVLAGWTAWLGERIDTGWRPGEWDGEARLFSGDPDNPRTVVYRCATAACDGLSRTRGLCATCEKAFRASELELREFRSVFVPDRNRVIAGQRAACRVAGCPRESILWGLCNAYGSLRHKHLQRDPGSDLDAWIADQKPYPPSPACAVPGCRYDARATFGLCSMHQTRWKKHNGRVSPAAPGAGGDGGVAGAAGAVFEHPPVLARAPASGGPPGDAVRAPAARRTRPEDRPGRGPPGRRPPRRPRDEHCRRRRRAGHGPGPGERGCPAAGDPPHRHGRLRPLPGRRPGQQGRAGPVRTRRARTARYTDAPPRRPGRLGGAAAVATADPGHLDRRDEADDERGPPGPAGLSGRLPGPSDPARRRRGPGRAGLRRHERRGRHLPPPAEAGRQSDVEQAAGRPAVVLLQGPRLQPGRRAPGRHVRQLRPPLQPRHQAGGGERGRDRQGPARDSHRPARPAHAPAGPGRLPRPDDSRTGGCDGPRRLRAAAGHRAAPVRDRRAADELPRTRRRRLVAGLGQPQGAPQRPPPSHHLRHRGDDQDLARGPRHAGAAHRQRAVSVPAGRGGRDRAAPGLRADLYLDPRVDQAHPRPAERGVRQGRRTGTVRHLADLPVRPSGTPMPSGTRTPGCPSTCCAS